MAKHFRMRQFCGIQPQFVKRSLLWPNFFGRAPEGSLAADKSSQKF